MTAILACSAVAAGALIQGCVGFGIALVAAPILALLHPPLVPGPMICAGMTLSMLVAYRDGRSADLTGIRPSLVGLPAGAMAGAATLALVPAERAGIPIGALILLAVLLSALGPHVTATVRNVFFASILAGLMQTVASVPGPPLALVYQSSSGQRLRGTLALLLLLSGAISLTALTITGHFGAAELRAGMVLIPGAVIGFAASTRAARWLDRGSVRWAVLIISALSGSAVIARALW